MPRRRLQQQATNDAAATTDDARDDAAVPLTHEQRVVEFLRRAMRSATHWRASLAMAKCLGVSHHKLLLTTDKNDTTNVVWATVLVLIFCTSQLTDLHELWYEMADAATLWLYQQPHFVENREDLVGSACALLNVHDVSATLENVFPEPKDDETRALEAALGDWKLCYLDEPPYTAYYWNEQTNMSTWRNPIETAQLERERREKKQQREQLLAKVLPVRVRINRDVVEPTKPRQCGECNRETPAAPRLATVYCTACEARYFCDECCDRVHSTRDKLSHIETSFRYAQCIGIKGFPKDTNTVATTSRSLVRARTPN